MRAATSRSNPKNVQLKVVVLPGDGVGPEVTAQVLFVLREIANIHGHNFQFSEHDAGGMAIERWGSPLPPATLDACVGADAVLLGAGGSPYFGELSPDKRPEARALFVG